MLIGDPVDTVMNLVVFAFLAALIWLFVRPLAQPDATDTVHRQESDTTDDAS